MRLYSISDRNLISCCVDAYSEYDFSGRIFHAYQKEAIPFANASEAFRIMESLYDGLDFPQATMEDRNFYRHGTKAIVQKDIHPVGESLCSNDELAEHRGERFTFLVSVRSRKRAEWQGEICCMETEEKYTFAGVLGLAAIVMNYRKR